MCDIMETRCRLCAECCSTQLSIMQDTTFCLKIFQLFQIKISAGDNLPMSVCPDCHDMVEKTWCFNDRVQKAQDLLAELVNKFNEMLTEESLEVPLLITDNGTDTTSMVDFGFMDLKNEDKCDFIPGALKDVDGLSDSSGNEKKLKEPVACSKRKVRTSRSGTRKNAKKKQTEDIQNSQTVHQISNMEFEVKSDGMMVQKFDPIFGWDTYPFSCCDCQLVINNSEELKDHYGTVHNSSPRYACAECPKVYTKYSVFLAHVRVHRPRLKLCCDICYKWFPTASEQDQHRSEHTDDKPHSCTSCGKKFRMQSALLVHARSHLPAEIKNQYQCDQCPKKFGTKPNLMAHKRIHTGIRDYTCDQCGKSFVQKGNLDNHLLTHTAARPFDCPACGKAFKTAMRLRKHASVHSGLKPHRCDVCGRQFRERGTLNEHRRIHTGAMPFACEFCGKCFRFKGVLTTHRRQHTGERPYSCTECQHHFTNWPNYNKHMKRRHGINTSVTCRTRQDIPPTGMPHRNPPGTVLAAPQPGPPAATTEPGGFAEEAPAPPSSLAAGYYPVLSLYNIPEELLQQRV
ncbi:unnamed protein product [Phaedon cochleariae]|uniref:Uncharacterized protein n=1 Tax=Phaedon cochleariae TaxID=80249 RepID=A0A9P0DW95_PHACE|nr:unnamed protein product [Phaedon cochleariae]